MHWKSSKRPLLLLCILLLQIAAAEDVLVTGEPASTQFLRTVLEERGWNHFPSRALAPGESWKSPRGNRVININWRPPEPSIAALSDHPEKVERRGGLFFGGLTSLRPLIFQYYHLGKMRGSDPHLSLILHNSGAEPATLHLQKGIGRTSLDFFSSGHTNNVRWFEAKRENLGYFVELAPGETTEIFRQELPREEVVSGTLGMTQTAGPPLSFAFVARPDSSEKISLNNLLKEDDVHSRGFYPAAKQVLHRTFEVGQNPLNIAVGAVRQQTFSGVRELRGDYGVTYVMNLELRNDTADPASVELIFNPRGGAATGTFLLDGKLLEVPITKAFEEQLFHTVELPAGQARRLSLETIPEGASSYPVRIVVKKR